MYKAELGYGKKLGIFALLGVIVLLSGCASNVRTQLNTFTAGDANFGEGTIAVKPARDKLGSSLEFELYQSKLESSLRDVGYTISTPEAARYIARLDYDVTEARPKVRHPDMFFSTGFGRYNRRGGVGFTLHDRSDYQDEYLRTLSLVITRTPDAQDDTPRRIYETTGVSKGSCPVMSVVFDEMLAAIFQNFPGESGKVRSVTVRGEGNCQ